MYVTGSAVVQRVAFTATMSKSIGGIGIGQTIVFDNIVTNIGNAYNPQTGKFVVPVSAFYVVTLTVYPNWITEEMYVEIVHDGTQLTDMLLDNVVRNRASQTTDELTFFLSFTSQWVFHLNEGSNVWVRTTSYSPLINILGQNHSRITCWLLYAD